ncbi:amidohydrolase family protein [Trujillonella endophytica]|uniref:Predicted amidohydrolase YtcJ n=1 Tax=Trujillonella endophytica TaxID=673521 RepID=A0A1H8W967_9ACTN|nr:amidohydrolase family protein [Trujillella endophytica]SEP23668.1 Predicted amidohydrolase YtcJ [Trujillella endophytica]
MSPVSGLLFRDVVLLDGRRVDVRVGGVRVVEVGPALHRTTEEVLPGRGGTLLPGLVDAHLHLHAMAAAARSVPSGPPAVTDAGLLRRALAAAGPGEDGWIRGTGYAETVAGDLDSAALDRLHAERPVRVQHRSGALWVVNSAGAAALGLASADHPGVERDASGRPTGRLWRADDWLRERLGPARLPDLTTVGGELTRFGITAVTDATPDLAPAAVAALAAARRDGVLPQGVTLLGAPLDGALPAGLTAGPVKIVLADSGLPDLDPLVARIRAAHAAGRAVAVHVVTREALALLLAALDLAGVRPGDRVEHAALVPGAVVADLARRGLRVVTQPGFLADRGDDYLRDVPADEHDDLYRAASLLACGVPVALSSDAPHGPLDPWRVLAAAVGRRTRAGAVVGAAERLGPAAALAAYLGPPDSPGGPPRAVAPGVPADLVLLDGSPADVLDTPSAERVRAVVLAGRTAHATEG